MKTRRHHNNKGTRATKRGKRVTEVQAIERRVIGQSKHLGFGLYSRGSDHLGYGLRPVGGNHLGFGLRRVES
jgi:hypothetical protein